MQLYNRYKGVVTMFFFDPINDAVKNEKNKTALKAVTIYGLFGKTDVSLRFDKTVNIYIGENGLGKTTILNCIYYLLLGEFEKMVSLPFNDIKVEFTDNIQKTISKADIISYVDKRRANRRYRFSEIFPYIHDIISRHSSDDNIVYDDDFREYIIVHLMNRFDFSYLQAQTTVSSYISNFTTSEKGDSKRIDEFYNIVSESIDERIIYLTTYRRIEKDYSDYFNVEKERYSRAKKDDLIRFGMRDVSQSIKGILEVISDKTNQGFNKMTGILLSKYAIAKQFEKNYKYKYIDKKLLKIVLDRLGKQIDEAVKKSILGLVETNQIYDEGYQYLRDLIDELIASYNQLKIYDERIIGFTETCNKYLNSKRFNYNPSEITLGLFSNEDEERIDLSMLSSGEKQIVSLFSRLYLENEKNCILLIDEPELSISMRWQKMLLPDIIRSRNCSLLLAVTHSPFIFENDFDNDAQDMWYCFNDR